MNLAFFLLLTDMSVNLMFQMQFTNFKNLFEAEIAKLKASSSANPQNNPIIRQFREAVWVYFFSHF